MMILVLIAISFMTFSISHLIPADPARLIAGPKANNETLSIIREKYGLDLPIHEQYIRYVQNLVRFDFGNSFSSRRPVFQDIKDFFPATVELSMFAFLIAIFAGIIIGVISATNYGSSLDNICSFLSIAGVSLPAFWLALLAQILFYQFLGWLPLGGRISSNIVAPTYITGIYTFDSLLAGQIPQFWDSLWHLILPGLIISLEPFGFITRITRASLLEVLHQDYIRTAKAKGASYRRIILIHSFKNALVPVVTSSGLMVGYLMGGSILIETIFAWPGIGRYASNAIISADYNAIMGVTTIIAFIYLIVNFFVDILCGWLDPRIK